MDWLQYAESDLPIAFDATVLVPGIDDFRSEASVYLKSAS